MISLEPQLLRSTDESFTLLRASGGHEHKSVLIVAPAVERPSAAHLGRLQRAYWLRHHIDPAWGTRPISLVEHEGRPALLLEDPGGVVLETLLGRLAASDFLRVAIAVAGSVSLLHASGLIHRDLRPSNVLVDVAEARAWLTGLCLASRGGAAEEGTELSELSGTLPYLAPERTGRRPEPADVRSDLYALGVTLYELATGQLPFVATEPRTSLSLPFTRPNAAVSYPARSTACCSNCWKSSRVIAINPLRV